jgi:hypothetical protein
MIRLLFGVLLVIAAVVGWTIGQTKKGQLGPARYYWLGWIVLVLLGLFLFISTSFAIVGPEEVVHLTRVYLGKPMPSGQVIALRGEKGRQAEVLGEDRVMQLAMLKEILEASNLTTGLVGGKSADRTEQPRSGQQGR